MSREYDDYLRDRLPEESWRRVKAPRIEIYKRTLYLKSRWLDLTMGWWYEWGSNGKRHLFGYRWRRYHPKHGPWPNGGNRRIKS